MGNTNPSVVDCLIQAGADISAKDKDGDTPIHDAAMLNNESVIEAIIQAGADIFAKNNKERTPLHLAASSNKNPSVVDCLIQAGADISAKDKDGDTPLHEAAQWNSNASVANTLLQAGGDIFAKNNEEETPLHLAAYNNTNPSVVDCLIQAGADISAKDRDGNTPLHQAVAWNGNTSVVNTLIQLGGDIFAKNNEGNTPLHVAAMFNNESMTEAIIQAGADISAKNSKERTPLHHAARSNKNPSVVDCLIQAGADISAKDDDGDTPLHDAAMKNNESVTELIIQAGADISAKNNKGQTPLHFASGYNDNPSVIDHLIQAGADLYAKDSNGETPLDLALKRRKHQNKDVVTLIQDYVDGKKKVNEPGLSYLGVETTEDFKDIMQKGSYKRYWNRVYLVGNYNVGKTTLAKILVGDPVPEVRASTNGIWLYIGLAGMDIQKRKWVYLPKGNATRKVLTTMLMSLKKQKAKAGVPSELNKDFKPKSFRTTTKKKDSIESPRQEVKIAEQVKLNKQNDEKDRPEEASCAEPSFAAELGGDELESMSIDTLFKLVAEAAKEGNYKLEIVPIDIWDFGGQKDYYMTHQLFLNSRGIFVLMFNGSQDLHKHMPDLTFLPGHYGKPTIAVYLRHWVNSILTYCHRTKNHFPRIIFVATHKDLIPKESLEEHREKLVQSIDGLFKDHAKLGHLEYKSLLFINARDKADEEIEKLRQVLMDRAFEHPSWGEEMPTAWIPLELELAQEVENGNNIISLKQIEALNDKNDSFKLTERQIVSFLKIQHALGKVNYFDDVDLRDFIVINPVYMIEILRSIITDKQFWPKGEQFVKAHEKLRRHGIIDKSTIFEIWKQEEFCHILPHKEYVLGILVRLDVIVAQRTRVESIHKPISDIRCFLVPCMITNPDQTDYMAKACTNDTSIILAYTFVDDVIPPALSYRFLGSCLTMWDLKDYKGQTMIFSDLAVVEVGHKHDVAVQVMDKRVVVYLVHSSSKDKIDPTLASSIQECLTSTIDRISEFYSSLAEGGCKSGSVHKPFRIEYGVFCESPICFFAPCKLSSSLKVSLKCRQHRKNHDIKELHYWYAEKKPLERCPDECTGLALLEKEQRPSDKHLRRLASAINNEKCHDLAINLNIEQNEWDSLEHQYKTLNEYDQPFMVLWKWRQRKSNACFDHLRVALINCDDNQHYLCQVLRDIDIGDIERDLIDVNFDTVPSDASLTDVSNCIGNSSLQLGIELGLEVPELQNIQTEHRLKPLEQTREILFRWSRCKHTDNTLRTLVKALKRIGMSSCLYDIL